MLGDVVMLPSTTAPTGSLPARERPTASLSDGSLDVSVYGVLSLHELFDHVRTLFAPIAADPAIRKISVSIRARDISRGGSPATDVEVEARVGPRPIWIRCVRPSAKAAVELAAVVLRMRLAGRHDAEAAE